MIFQHCEWRKLYKSCEIKRRIFRIFTEFLSVSFNFWIFEKKNSIFRNPDFQGHSVWMCAIHLITPYLNVQTKLENIEKLSLNDTLASFNLESEWVGQR